MSRGLNPFRSLVWPGVGPRVDWQRAWPELAVIVTAALLFGRRAPATDLLGLLVAGTGMWWLGVVLGTGRLGRTWAGLMFTFAGVVATAYGQQYGSLVLGCAWLPWALAWGLAAMQAQRGLYAALAAAALGLTLLAGDTGLTVATLLVTALLVLLAAIGLNEARRPRLAFDRTSALIVLVAGALGCGLAAIQLLPVLAGAAAERWPAVLDPAAGGLAGVLAALFTKPAGNSAALAAYVGIVPLLCLVGLPQAVRSKAQRPLVGLGLLVALALTVAATGWLTAVRLPAALLAWVVVALFALAGAGLDALWQQALANLTLRRVRVPEAAAWAAARVGLVVLPVAALWAAGNLYATHRPLLLSTLAAGNRLGLSDLLRSNLAQQPVAFWIGAVMSGASFLGVLALIVSDHRARRRRIETEAIYREGVLQPESALGLPDGTQVHVTITPSGEGAAEEEAPAAIEPATAQSVEPAVLAAIDPAVAQSVGSAAQPAAPARQALDRMPVLPANASVWASRIAWVLFVLGLGVYLLTRLWGIEHFPIFFFTDEATFALLAEDLLSRGLRDAQGAFLPLYFEVAGNRWTPVLAVYAHLPAVAILGKSILATRTTAALVTLLCPIAVALSLKSVFRVRYWWAGALLVAVVPTWFLHSRTAFEWLMMASCYACFLLSYLLYRTRSPKFLFAAILFGAFTFYNHASGQLVMAAVTLFLLISDFRYHLKNWRTILLGLLLVALLAIPILRFQAQHPGAMFTHLRAVDSYWFRDVPLVDKLRQFASTYLYGLSPAYWFVPNAHDLERHRMMGYGNLGFIMLPLVLSGAVLCLWRVRSPAHRAVLLAVLAAPAGAATAEVAITRMMAFVPPACIIAGLGLNLFLEWAGKALRPASEQSGKLTANSRLVNGALALVVFAGLSGASLWMLRDAVKNGPTWYTDYELYGMQYGARQLFVEAIPEFLAEHPDMTVAVSPNWANGTDTFIRFFFPREQQFTRVQMRDVRYYMVDRRELSPGVEFVMTPEEYEQAKTSGKFKSIDVDRTVPYPDGRVGFYFARLAYADNLDEVLAKEREERSRPVIEQLELDGQSVQVSHSQLDIGLLPNAFDDDAYTLIRGLEANPLVFDFAFPQSRQIGGLSATFGSMDFTLKISLYADGAVEPVVYEQSFRGLPPDPTAEVLFDQGPTLVSRLRLEVLQLNAGTETHIHVREIKFK